ncbi:SDR family NAD(P)-dependent oxidoreductase [Microlunatus parietis]|uniref:NAD(P)-dependent dehydrogenase (Short-subunit alcohol dehydrogenase family) n=1 Tax=Microlunatus parietis TaxID=682979 RepID=A0A7Y9I5W0_9ACTN|nr:SDR family NAD(P)-dependent oxidoreductase [Microlunatus parietis]NYE70673.1 NAD(P)-dependent dehydrogenase (short-subunit alcohol dehydrogenase family) [Microlunatus parietis]
MRFAGRRVLITGAARNIGLDIARRFLAEGAAVAVNDLDPDDVRAAVENLAGDGGTVLAAPADLADPAAIESMIASMVVGLGGLDVLINNAAVQYQGRVPFAELSLADWDATFTVNARGTFLCTAAAAKIMRPGSSVINVSSIGATKAHRRALAYDSTKGAIEAFTRAAALELAPQGIRVNAVAPGAVITDRNRDRTDDLQDRHRAQIPLGRAATGADIAAAVSFLASPDADYITGHVLAVDGGLGIQARQPSEEANP